MKAACALGSAFARCAAALENHAFAVTMTRALDAAAAGNVEYRVALALALAGRGDAYALFARAPGSRTRAEDLALAERDYAEAVALYAALDQQGRPLRVGAPWWVLNLIGDQAVFELSRKK